MLLLNFERTLEADRGFPQVWPGALRVAPHHKLDMALATACASQSRDFWLDASELRKVAGVRTRGLGEGQLDSDRSPDSVLSAGRDHPRKAALPSPFSTAANE
jgi:hypothetical protein